jgi:hypothetical protein
MKTVEVSDAPMIEQFTEPDCKPQNADAFFKKVGEYFN